MKLRNKKTGKIERACPIYVQNCGEFNSLAELNEEWEDYEEPREHWYIDYDGGILCGESDNSSAEKMMISIGNHFDSIEEAERAIEKLKAWKRLKDKGFKFDGYNACSVDYDIDEQYRKNISQDLDLLFGGEE